MYDAFGTCEWNGFEEPRLIDAGEVFEGIVRATSHGTLALVVQHLDLDALEDMVGQTPDVPLIVTGLAQMAIEQFVHVVGIFEETDKLEEAVRHVLGWLMERGEVVTDMMVE